MNEHVPIRPRRTPNRPVWVTREVLRAIRRKRRLWKKAKRGQKEMAKYIEAEKDTARQIRNAKRAFKKKLAKEKNNNSRPFYSYTKGRTKNRAAVGPLRDSQGNTVTEDEAISEMLNNYFASVFTDEGNGPVPAEDATAWNAQLSDFSISIENVSEKIKKLRPSAAPGPDKIGPGLLQQLRTEVSPILATIFKKSLESGIVPEDW